MIDVMAIATNGYVCVEKKPLSIATDGYYTASGIAIRPETPGYAQAFRKQEVLEKRSQDEDLILIIKIFMDLWVQ